MRVVLREHELDAAHALLANEPFPAHPATARLIYLAATMTQAILPAGQSLITARTAVLAAPPAGTAALVNATEALAALAITAGPAGSTAADMTLPVNADEAIAARTLGAWLRTAREQQENENGETHK